MPCVFSPDWNAFNYDLFVSVMATIDLCIGSSSGLTDVVWVKFSGVEYLSLNWEVPPLNTHYNHFLVDTFRFYGAWHFVGEVGELGDAFPLHIVPKVSEGLLWYSTLVVAHCFLVVAYILTEVGLDWFIYVGLLNLFFSLVHIKLEW